MTGNPYYTADTKISAQLQLHPFVYNSPLIPPFSKFHPLVSRIHPKGCMCTPVEKHCSSGREGTLISYAFVKLIWRAIVQGVTTGGRGLKNGKFSVT